MPLFCFAQGGNVNIINKDTIINYEKFFYKIWIDSTTKVKIIEYFYKNDSTLYFSETLFNDMIIGNKNTYYKNGKILTSELYFFSSNIGKYHEYYPNGNIKVEGSFKDNFDLNNKILYIDTVCLEDVDNIGEMICVEEIFNSPKQNEWRYYYENGKLQLIGKYELNKRVGKWLIYNSNETLQTIIIYKDGEIIEKLNKN
jgi:antitoxin component YwqK of YwqJK toxin-antitoxin module